MNCNVKSQNQTLEHQKINLLIEQLKDEITIQQNKNKQLKKLQEIIYDYSHENTHQFTASYNVIRLKAIIHNMFEIIQSQDERIRELERK